jgi:hypothetical protein
MNAFEHSSRLNGWWDFAVGALGMLTMPPADTRDCDRVIDQLVRDSRAGGLARRANAVARRAWVSSRCRVALSGLAAVVRPEPPTAAWRLAGWMTAVAGATALAVDRLAPIAGGPLTWVVPVALVGAGVFAMAAAAPLSRADADKVRRQSTTFVERSGT